MCFNVEITNFERRRHDSYENVKRLKFAKILIFQNEIDVDIKTNVFRFDVNEKKNFRFRVISISKFIIDVDFNKNVDIEINDVKNVVENESDNVDDVDENDCEKLFNFNVNN